MLVINITYNCTARYNTINCLLVYSVPSILMIVYNPCETHRTGSRKSNDMSMAAYRVY